MSEQWSDRCEPRRRAGAAAPSTASAYSLRPYRTVHRTAIRRIESNTPAPRFASGWRGVGDVNVLYRWSAGTILPTRKLFIKLHLNPT